jgi:hypothetical protein
MNILMEVLAPLKIGEADIGRILFYIFGSMGKAYGTLQVVDIYPNLTAVYAFMFCVGRTFLYEQ